MLEKKKLFLLYVIIFIGASTILSLLLALLVNNNTLISSDDNKRQNLENALVGYILPLYVLFPLTIFFTMSSIRKKLSPWTVDVGTFLFGLGVGNVVALVTKDYMSIFATSFTTSIVFILLSILMFVSDGDKRILTRQKLCCLLVCFATLPSLIYSCVGLTHRTSSCEEHS